MHTEELANIKTEIQAHEAAFIELIRQRLGIIIPLNHHDLYKAIVAACMKFDYSPKEYLTMLAQCEHDSPLLEHLVSHITIGETYFFRDKNQMRILREHIIPALILKKRADNNLFLRIWSAGCSSGEEIYTIAMLLMDVLPDINKWKINLLGTDINTQALLKAFTGTYSEWSMRATSEYYKNHFFSHENNQYKLIPELTRLVHFDYLNLNEASYPSMLNGTNAQDLILCRNVLIYFDNNQTKKLMQRLSASLVTDGYLLIGASDPVNVIDTNLIRMPTKTGFFTNQNLVNASPKIVIPKKLPSAKVPTAVKSTRKNPVTTVTTTTKTKISEHDNITNLVKEANWEKALELINKSLRQNSNSISLLNMKAQVLANLGKLVEAEIICRECIALKPNTKEIYFTYGMILAELNKVGESEEAFRKTLFLDHQFVHAHLQLGLLLLRSHNKEAGLKSLKNALAIVNAHNPTHIVPDSPELNYGRLAEILKNEILLYVH